MSRLKNWPASLEGIIAGRKCRNGFSPNRKKNRPSKMRAISVAIFIFALSRICPLLWESYVVSPARPLTVPCAQGTLQGSTQFQNTVDERNADVCASG